MEVTILQAEGIDGNSLVSIRAGQTRRQAPVTHKRPFRFPSLSLNGCVQIDVLQPVASGRLNDIATDEVHSVVFPTAPGSVPMSMTLQVRDAANTCKDAATGGFRDPDRNAEENFVASSSVNAEEQDRQGGAVAVARAYLDRTNLLGVMQELMRSLLREMPDDPITFMIANLPLSSSKSKVMEMCAEKVDNKHADNEHKEWHVAENENFRNDIEKIHALCKQQGLDCISTKLDTPWAMRGSSLEALRGEHQALRCALTKLCEEVVESGLGHPKKPTPQESDKLIKQIRKNLSMGNLSEVVADMDNDVELADEPPAFWRPRSNAVSSDGYGLDLFKRMNSKCRRNSKELEIPKSNSQRDDIIKALRQCPIFGHLRDEVLQGLVRVMPVRKYELGSTIVRQGDDSQNEMFVILSGTVGLYSTVGARKIHINSLGEQDCFGELAMLWRTPRSLTALAREKCEVAVLSRELYEGHLVKPAMSERDLCEHCIRHSTMLDFLLPDQISKLADTVTRHHFSKGDAVIEQGEIGETFFIVLNGECIARVTTGSDVQDHRRYYPGDLFGELALINENSIRQASIVACTAVEVLAMTRAKFERLVGPVSKLRAVKYMTDPRECIAKFFSPGSELGPGGVAHAESEEHVSKWFAVYRPTSRDAIARMLSGQAVGKGLNVKGKSAKGNRLSGFVPFLQISENEHKQAIEKPPKDSSFQVYWYSDEDRKYCEAYIKALLEQLDDSLPGIPRGSPCPMEELNDYHDAFGLKLPEAIVHYMFIQKPDLSFPAGWETGRVSEPSFMDMNLHVLRSAKADPPVVLFQADPENPVNPHGLLMAYAESSVKPVVSDFDTFLVGSKGMHYETLAPEQVKLARWTLKHTKEILESPTSNSWTTRWLDILKQAVQDGELSIETPKYGLGDATSYFITTKIVEATRESGAVRHGAECFNFVFPQELDVEYLVIWDGFEDKRWEYLDEDELREFLIRRAGEGFAFPLNPVWMVRDVGWFEVLRALQSNEMAEHELRSWYPPDSGLLEQIAVIHENHPDGFVQKASTEGAFHRTQSKFGMDLSGCERVDLALEVVRKEAVARKIRNAAKALSCLGVARRLTIMAQRKESMPKPTQSDDDSSHSPGSTLMKVNIPLEVLREQPLNEKRVSVMSEDSDDDDGETQEKAVTTTKENLTALLALPKFMPSAPSRSSSRRPSYI